MKDRNKRIFVAGHHGMVGSALLRQLKAEGFTNVVTRDRVALDLARQQDVENFFLREHFDLVYLAAARVGGIAANNAFPADFIYQNLIIECNVIHSAHMAGIDRLIFLGSSCIYPKYAAQPLKETDLLNGKLEPTNEPYGIAKIAGVKLCESYNRQYGRDYRVMMPTNLYGPNDNFHRDSGHVIPALFLRFHDAARNGGDVTVWGSGRPLREFMHVDDMASATIHLAEIDKLPYQGATHAMCSHINIGTGKECSIAALADMIARISGFKGNILFDVARPDGTPRKVLDVSLLHSLGWHARIPLDDGLRHAYKWFLENQISLL